MFAGGFSSAFSPSSVVGNRSVSTRNCCSALLSVAMSEAAFARFASDERENTRGIISAAKIPKIMITTISSISVNALRLLFIYHLLSFHCTLRRINRQQHRQHDEPNHQSHHHDDHRLKHVDQS